ncbi:MAG TPA: tRNA (adenosine(37)-N6)-threonylcarbamoyltransferase complex dimerization subunit type 1 TsaB [Terriglobales bacterium]|nr:tRNA (adenosine(37)-N6)-threonylcarbamoyltransferase complex dimerization subunit type 1 TsaB [Terriglobales bacterium]
MLILAIDTSNRQGSVALGRGDAETFETLQLTPVEGGTYSARLLPTIDALLQQHSLSATDLDGFAIVTGPGSFTGLRVGLATVKGLCEILHKPLATVSMLEAVVTARGSTGHDTAILDASRGEIYVGEYEVAANGAAPLHECIVKLNDFAEADRGGERLTPDKTVADFLQQKNVSVRLVTPVQADIIARIGVRKLLTSDATDHATVDVNYIRRSDAEIFSTPK